MQPSPTTEQMTGFQAAVEALRDRRGLGAWQAFLRAHASLMRDLGTDLSTNVDLSLGDFDVLFQLANAGGELRVTDLAARVFLSRSALTRRMDRMVKEGVVRRSRADADGRSVVIEITERGTARLLEALPVHLAGVERLFVQPLDDDDLAQLERSLNKVATNCSFG